MENQKIEVAMTELPFQYFVPDQPQLRLGAYLTVAGHETYADSKSFPSPLHNAYYVSVGNGRKLKGTEHQIFYIRDGKGTVKFKCGKCIQVKAGSVNILRPNEWHRQMPDAKAGWEEVYIGLGGEMVERVVRELFPNHEPVVIDTSSVPKFDTNIMSLVAEILADEADKPHSLAIKALSLIASLAEIRSGMNEDASTYIAIRRANFYIARHLSETIDLGALAHRSGLSYSYFRRCFRAYTGCSPLAYQLSLRIWRAKRLLKGTDMPISEIAKALGFYSQAYFARFFRKDTGMSPTSYRASLAAKR